MIKSLYLQSAFSFAKVFAMEILSELKFFELQNEFFTDFVFEDSFDVPCFGDIWICKIPLLVVKEEGVFFETMNRPVLVIDDGHGHLILNDQRNYYVLKITSQADSYQRIKIKNYCDLGLQKESFIRIEVPLKVEKEQFLYKIGKYDAKEMNVLVKKVLKNMINKAI